jgi:hypothetical protein
MPVSKKRKKDGKPVQRSHPVPEGGSTHPEDRPEHGGNFRTGKPTNPFVAQQQQSKRGAQRGR